MSLPACLPVRRSGADLRRRPLALISLISGLSSGAFDRLWSVKILTFDFPAVFGTSDPAFWFTVLALIGTLLSLVSSVALNKPSPERVSAAHPNDVLALLAGLQVVAPCSVTSGWRWRGCGSPRSPAPSPAGGPGRPVSRRS